MKGDGGETWPEDPSLDDGETVFETEGAKKPEKDTFASEIDLDSSTHTVQPPKKPQKKKTLRKLIKEHDFSLGKELGRGGMGSVHLARQTDLDSDVVVKYLHKVTPDSKARFVREAKLMRKAKHPGVPTVIELGEKDGKPYMAMELVRGQNLKQILDDGNTSREDLLDVFTKILDAMAYSHSQDIVHRDLKPENIMIGEFGEAQVLDFGLAKQEGQKEIINADGEDGEDEDGRLTLDGMVMGTPAYMAPEQMDGEPEKRSDVYSLGAVLYELLTDIPIREHRAAREVIARAVETNFEVKKPRKLDHTIDPALQSIVMKALEAKKKKRYQTVAEMRKDLVAFVRGEKVSSHKYTLGQKWKQWKKEHPKLLASLQAGTAASLLGAAGIFYMGQEAANARSEKAQVELKHADEIKRQNEANHIIRNTKFTYDVHKNFDTYVSKLEEAVKAAPSWSVPRFELGMANYETRHFEEAIEQFEKASKLNKKKTGNVDAHALFMAAMTAIDQSDRPDLAGKFTDRVLKNGVDKKEPYARLCKSISAFNEGDMETAIDEAEAVADNAGKISEAFYLLSMYHSGSVAIQYDSKALWEHNDFKKAEEFISKAIESNDERWRYFAHRAQLRLNQGNLENALSDVNHSLDQGAHTHGNYSLKASILKKFGKHDDALEVIDLAENRFNGLNSATLAMKAMIFIDMGDAKKGNPQHLYSQAEKCLEQAVKLSNKTGDKLLLGNARASMGKFEESLEIYNSVLASEPSNSRALYWKGIALGRMNRVDEAIETIESYLRTGNPHDRTGISGYLQQLKDFKEKK